VTRADADAIPLMDLKAQHAELGHELQQAVLRVLHSQQFILGGEGKALEAEASAYLGVPHAVGCASGSDAILLALRALDLGPDDAVVTTPLSFFATAGAPVRLGCRVDFVDVEPDTFNLSVASLRAFLDGCTPDADGALREPRAGKRVAAVIAVDLFGRPCDYPALEPLCRERGVRLIEDAAQAFGARQGDRRCGAFGDAATFSFYPSKNLGAAGDAGLVTSRDDDLAERIRRLRVHGSGKRRYVHEEVGWNSRLDEIQAAVLRVKLPRIDAWNAARQEHARAYDAALAEVPGVRPLAPPSDGTEAIYHLYVVRAERRDALKEHLAGAGVATGVYYPVPLHLQECFAYLGYRPGDLPDAEAACEDSLALPMFPELTAGQRDRVIAAIRGFDG